MPVYVEDRGSWVAVLAQVTDEFDLPRSRWITTTPMQHPLFVKCEHVCISAMRQ